MFEYINLNLGIGLLRRGGRLICKPVQIEMVELDYFKIEDKFYSWNGAIGSHGLMAVVEG